MKHYFFAILLVVAVAASGCSYESQTSTTAPSSTGLASLIVTAVGVSLSDQMLHGQIPGTEAWAVRKLLA